MHILATILVMASTITGQPCAAIDNGPNVAMWTEYHAQGNWYEAIGTTYRDNGENLRYKVTPPRRARHALNRTERSLQAGTPGHKVRIACAD